MNRHLIKSLATTLVFLLLASCRPFFQREVSGRILSLEGTAQGSLDGKTFPLTKGDWIHPGEKIVSSPHSRVDLMVLPGIFLELSGETEIQITQLRLKKDGAESIHAMTAREASLRLQRGTVIGAIAQAPMRSTLSIETAQGTLRAFDLRTFELTVNDQQAKVMSVRGRLAFTPANQGAATKIGAGYFADFPITASGPRAAAEAGPEVQADVTRILAVEKRLSRLGKEERVAFPPGLGFIQLTGH